MPTTQSLSERVAVRDRRATVAVAVQFAVNGAGFASFMPRLPELRERIGGTTTSIGILLAVASASGLVSSLTCRRVIARFGTRDVLMWGGLAVSVALVLVGLSRSWLLALVGLGAMFAFDVYVDVAMNMQGSWLSGRRTRPIMNRLHGLWSLGSVAGGLVATRLAGSSISLAIHLGIAAAILAVVSTVVAQFLLRSDEAQPDAAAGSDETASQPASDRRWSTPLTGLFVAGLTAVVVETTAINWAAFRISDDLNGTATMAALAYVGVVGGITIGRFVGDHLTERFGNARVMRTSAVVAVLSVVASAVVNTASLVVVAFVGAGLGTATLLPHLYDTASKASNGSARGLGALTAGSRIATIVTPALVATVATATSVGTAMAAATVVAGALFLVALRPFIGRP